MSPTIALLVLLVAADIALWCLAIVGPLSEKGRFRAYTVAIVLTLVLAASYFGWGRTLSVGGLVAWIAAILVANTKQADPRTA